MRVAVEYDKEFEEIAETALRKWGYRAQIQMMCEECAELITVLLKRNRNVGGSTIQEIIEELVDVEIMLGQMKNIYGINQKIWANTKEDKLSRLKERLEV